MATRLERRRQLIRDSTFGNSPTAISCDRCGTLPGTGRHAQDHALDNPGHAVTVIWTSHATYCAD